MYQIESLRSSSITVITSINHQLTVLTEGRLQKPQYLKTLIYIGCVSESAILCYPTRYTQINLYNRP